jgi:signal peptidase I
MDKRTKRKSTSREWIESILIAVLLALIVRSFIIEPFKIPSGSMEPTLQIGDKILVNKFIYGARVPFTDIFFPAVREPKTGDIIVFKYPINPKRDFIKRLIAKGSDRVTIKDGNIYLNGKRLNNSLINKFYYYAQGPYGEKEVVVPEGHYYVLGDHSGENGIATSRDSRFWGYVPEKNRVGKAFLIWWPPHRIGILK